jgi:amino acid adenylation domain-containing protein
MAVTEPDTWRPQVGQTTHGPEVPERPPSDTHRPRSFPLSPGQEELWYLNQLAPGDPVYNESMTMSKTGDFDVDAFRTAFNAMVVRHEIWRTTFKVIDGEPRQVVQPPNWYELDVVDLAMLPKAEAEREAIRILAETVRIPYDLENGPMLRPLLVRLSADEHRFYLSGHHLIADAVGTVRVIFPELIALYDAAVAGASSPLTNQAIQYGDYAAWERDFSESAEFASRVDYWKQRLGDAPSLLLPVDHSRPTFRSFRGGSEPVNIPSDLADSLRLVGRRAHATLFRTLASAFSVLLQRYSGQDDVVFGSMANLRPRSELADAVGYCVTPVVLRVDVGGEPSFLELVGRARPDVREALANKIPFGQIVRALNQQRLLGANPIFQAVLNLEPPSGHPRSGWTLQLSDAAIEDGIGRAKFDLVVQLHERLDGSIGGYLAYNADLFERETAQRMVGHLTTLLQGIVAEPDAPISELPLMTGEERRQQLVEWNSTEADFPSDSCLHELIREQARRTPDAIAVADRYGQITYSELDLRAGLLAQRLSALGVGRDVLVGVFLERSIELAVALLAVLRAGGAYVPLEPDQPSDRLAYMISDAKPAAILTTSILRAGLDSQGASIVLVDQPEAEQGISDPTDDSGATPTSLAYVMYTSGSTGRPKGVMIEHRSIINQLVWMVRTFSLGPGDIVLQKTPFGFDPSVWEIFCPLISGGKLVMLDPGAHMDAHQIGAAIRTERITTLMFVPTMLRTFVECGAARGCDSVRHVASGGEALAGALVRRFFDWFGPNVELRNIYGPTETSVNSTSWHCEPGDDVNMPIGLPIANTQIYLLDHKLRLVPAGVPAELCVGGVGVARGYLNLPELTADRFIDDPFGLGGRLYRTGDQARYRLDGVLEYLGRTDDQVKIRGSRIELGEVEAAIVSHPDVLQAVAVSRNDSHGSAELIAYLVPLDGARVPTGAELRSHLTKSLTPAMMPSGFVVLDAIPFTPNGKVDRKALPAPDYLGREYVAPRTSLERRLAQLFEEVLGREQVGINDDFFELGGHSLLAAGVVTRLGELLGRTVPLRSLFEHSSVAGLAAALGAVEGSVGVTASSIVRLERSSAAEQELPCSFGQERLWFLSELDPEASRAYNVAGAFEIEGELSPSLLERAINMIVARHETLRTGLVTDGGDLRQLVQRSVHVALPVLETSDAELGTVLKDEGRRPFNLEVPPLFRVTLLRIGPTRHVLTLTMHHTVVDGWSIGVFGSELAAAYSALRQGVDPELPELLVQYADFAAWQREWMAGSELNSQLSYWRKQLGGVEPLSLPSDHPRPSRQSYRGLRRRVRVEPELVAGLEQLAQEEGATLYMALLTVFSCLLSRLSGQEELVVGSPIATRPRSELEPLIGFFVNTIALRCNLVGDPTFREALRRIRETALEAYENQDIPFEKVVEELQPERTLSHPPVFQVMLVLQNVQASALNLDQTSVRQLNVDYGMSKFDLTLELVPADDALEATLEANADLFGPESAERLLKRFGLLLEGAIREPDHAISELDIISFEERGLLQKLGHAKVSRRIEASLHQLFMAQVARTPSAEALTFGDQRLTYRDVDERSNQIAHYLEAQGVRRGSLVALCLERSPDLVCSILAVLKMGGAYVPIDPDLPAERVAFMFEDSGALLVVTEESVLPQLGPGGPQVVVLEQAAAAIGSQATTPLTSQSDPSDLAYVIYTSGSTGRPKAVLVEHGNVVRLFASTKAWIEPSGDDVWTLFHSYAFDFSVWELWGALLHGGRLVVIPRDVARSPDDFHALLVSERVTVLNQTPSAFAELTQSDARSPRSAELSLRLVIFGGEALDFRMLAEWFARHGDERPKLVNMYGITETTVHVTYRPLSAADAGSPVSLIGQPISDLSAYVVDRKLQPLRLAPLGVVGELCIGGAGVARGYLNRPELTAERFVPDPFSPAGGRLYRSGDLVRLRPNGDLEYLGRSDFQVKVRGFRIEPGEIEAAIAAHRSVRQAVVMMQEDPHGDPSLVAYVVPDGAGGTPDSRELRNHLKASLPSYMVPAAFVVVEALPIDANGKIDRRALPKPVYSDVRRAGYVSPQGEVEMRLAALFARVLGVNRVGREDDFFDLGGHSLQAARLLREVEAELGVKVPLASVFQGGATIAAMAAVIADSRHQAGDDDGLMVPIQATGSAPVLFFIHADEASLLSLHDFSSIVGPDQPVVGLLPERVERRFDPSRGIEELAESMLATIRATQPHGPYLLGGFSLGGLMAYEIAGRLAADGDRVAWLGIGDAALRDLYQGSLWSRTPRGFATRVRELGPRRSFRVARNLAWRLARIPLVRVHLLSPLALGYDFDSRGAALLGSRYAPQGHAVPVDLFTSAETVSLTGSPSLGWDSVHQGLLRIHPSAGDHFSLLTEPSLRALAESLRESMRTDTDPASHDRA